MPTRKKMTLVAALVAVLGVALGSQFAEAKEPPAKSEKKASQDEAAGDSASGATAGKRAPRPSTGTAKLGEACKTDNDCDQVSADMRCAKSKCEYDVSRAHPAT